MMFLDAPPILPDPESAEEMLVDVNEIRRMRNLPTVRLRDDLSCASSTWAKNQWRRKACSHTDSSRSQFPDRVRECGGWLNGGYQIIACGVKDFKMATGMWLRDLSSASAILKSNVEFIGVGMAGQSLGDRWYVLIVESPNY